VWRKLVFNAPEMTGRRKQLRNNATVVEKLLWSKLRNSQLGVKFTRQYSVENYVVDFYCPKKKLAIELDGESHAKKKEYDAYRTRTLEAYGVKEIRFWNGEVKNEAEEVVRKISQSLC